MREALDRGVGRDRLRAGDLVTPHRGTRASAPVGDDLRSRARAIRPLLTEGRHLSHVTAAELLGMRVPPRAGRALHVTFPQAARAMRRPGVVGHRTRYPAPTVVTSDGLPVSDPVEAWLESAAILGVDDLVVMGDGLVRRRSPVATLDALWARIDRPGRRGAAKLRTALGLMRPGTDSAPETMLRLLIVRHGLPEPVPNAELTDARGRVVGHGDLVWPDRRLVVEYDGRHHAEDDRQFSIDIRRLNAIQAAGYRVIRVDRALLASHAALLRQLAFAYSAEESRRGP